MPGHLKIMTSLGAISKTITNFLKGAHREIGTKKDHNSLIKVEQIIKIKIKVRFDFPKQKNIHEVTCPCAN